MNRITRFFRRPIRPCLGLTALLVGGSVAAASQSPTASARVPGFERASAQLMAQAEAQAARDHGQAGMSLPCTRKHRHGLRYSVQRLDIPGGAQAFPTALNNHGWVVGYSFGGRGVQPTLWIGSRAFDLGTLGGNYGYAYDINDAGKIVGQSTSDETFVYRAFVWYRGRISALPGVGSDAGAASAAWGVNRAGVIAGESYVGEQARIRAVLWRDGVPRALDDLGGSYASATRSNDAGYTIGFGNNSSGIPYAMLWTPKGNVIDLGTQSVALDINNGGRIVGYTISNATEFRPAKWYRGVRHILPTLGGQHGVIYRINEGDQAVGYSQTPTGQERATIWFGSRPVQLDTLLDEDSQGIVINAAYAINDKGQIAAVESVPGSGVRPLLLTPRRCHAG